MKFKYLGIVFTLVGVATLVGCNSGADSNSGTSPSLVTNISVNSIECRNSEYNQKICYGAGNNQSPFIVPSSYKDGIESPVTGQIKLTYTNMGNTQVTFDSVLLQDTLNYNLIDNQCNVTLLPKTPWGTLDSCDVIIALKTNNKGNLNMQLPIITFTDNVESYPVQKQFLFNNQNIMYLTVSNAGNVVNGYLGTGNNVSGTVGLTSNVQLSFMTNTDSASDLSIDLTPLTSLIGANSYTFKCANVEPTGQVCQYNIQYKPTAAINENINIPFSYNNNVGAYTTGEIPAFINITN